MEMVEGQWRCMWLDDATLCVCRWAPSWASCSSSSSRWWEACCTSPPGPSLPRSGSSEPSTLWWDSAWAFSWPASWGNPGTGIPSVSVMNDSACVKGQIQLNCDLIKHAFFYFFLLHNEKRVQTDPLHLDVYHSYPISTCV